MARESMGPGNGVSGSNAGRRIYLPNGLQPPLGPTPRVSEQTLEPSEMPESASSQQQDDFDDEKSLDDGKSSLVLGPRAVEEQSDPERDVEKNTTNGEAQNRDPNLIVWDDPSDPVNPMNWPRWKKWNVTMLLVFSTATVSAAKKFGVSNEVMVLGTSLFVLGFAVGPPVWGPLSELYGRKIPLFTGFFIFAIFQIPVAVAQNLQAIMLYRFFGGVFGSAPLGTVGGTLTDFWGPVDRGVAMAIFAGATFIGPAAGPIVGGFIVQSHLGWRRTEYLTAIMSFFFGTIDLLFKIRHETRNWAVHALSDEQQVDLHSIAQKYLIRPFAMLALEPILDLVTLYMSLIYGTLYLFFEVYPIAFQEQRGWNSGVGALPFLSITIGVLLGGVIIVWTSKTRFARKLEKHGRIVPEERLIPMIIGGALFPIGMFWFAWTADKDITWVPQGLDYIIDCYLIYANSAIAANTFVRSLFGAGYHTLGVNWSRSLLGFLTAALFPVPILFYFYGSRIRAMSGYAPSR
ncbi:MFS general substrate transporter [Lindgomyces ingoldianus]|uniref:MFS general substrate transporter n=1 Tax=Lindgomyces ingoldianus TaxID=673940 RepID=A0ACB6QHD5_9PLEO|nr:MFS general substrate transporter [Lindgomyces ingoldianus]KAF2465762.1 MFS general substrate transporter [Lindgomyces ingoldianus]